MQSRDAEAVVLVLEGHLTEDVLQEALTHTEHRIGSGSRGLIVECSMMTSYTPEARALFVKWNREHKGALTHVAVVTIKPMWRLVVSAMSLASTQEMRAFNRLADARSWI